MKWFENLRRIAFIETGPIEIFDQFLPQSSNVLTLDLFLYPANFTVTKDLFKPLCSLNSSLTTLILNESHVSEIENSAFTCFPFLSKLDLSVQAVSFNTLSDTSFDGLDYLEILSLRANAFTHIPSAAFKTFARTGSLKYLDMGVNKLDGGFAHNAFESVTSLTHLDLSYNPLKFIGNWVDILTNLTYLNIEGSTSNNIFSLYNAIPLTGLLKLHFNNPMYSDILKDSHSINTPFILSQKVPKLNFLNLAFVTLYTVNTIKNLTFLQHLDVSGSFTVGNIIEE